MHRSPLRVSAAATFDAVSFLKKAFFKNSTPTVLDAAFAANLIAEVSYQQVHGVEGCLSTHLILALTSC